MQVNMCQSSFLHLELLHQGLALLLVFKGLRPFLHTTLLIVDELLN
jgi:hypothetical protein